MSKDEDEPCGCRERDLSGNWLFQVDRCDIGEKKEWFAAGHDRRTWRKVWVPGAWDFYSREMRDYEGVAWYALELPSSFLKRGMCHRIVFGAVHNHAKVWMNGRPVTEHFGGYLPFEAGISGAVRKRGSQSLVLRVDNVPRKDWLPGNSNLTVEWVQYGGILRDVKLVSSARIYISGLHVRAFPVGKGARIKCDLELANTSEQMFDGQIEAVIRAGNHVITSARDITCKAHGLTTRRLFLELPKAKLWTLERPVLYNVKAVLKCSGKTVDTLTERFGIRTIEAKDGNILLNGRPISIRGFNRYDEMFPGGVTHSPGKIRAELLKIKKTGANMIRTGHYPQDPVHYRIMDEIGLLAFEEAPLNWWRIPETRPKRKLNRNDRAVIRKAERFLRDMICRDRNHPCVAIWSMSNECGTDRPAGIMAMRRLLRTAKRLDPERLVTFVAAEGVKRHKAFSDADIVCTNIYRGKGVSHVDGFPCGVHEGALRDLKERQACWPDKPLLVSEFGNESYLEFHGCHGFTEEHHAEYLKAMWMAIRETPGVIGGLVWSWADYRHQKNFCAYHGPYGLYGVVSFDRRPKKAYDMICQLWRKER